MSGSGKEKAFGPPPKVLYVTFDDDGEVESASETLEIVVVADATDETPDTVFVYRLERKVVARKIVEIITSEGVK